MKDNINFHISDFGPISEADIEIAKINVIGGQNSTGKSTASKLLYSILRSSFSKRGEFAYEKIERNIKDVVRNVYGRYGIERPEYVNLKKLTNLKLLNKNNKERHFDDLNIYEQYLQAKDDYKNNKTLNRFIDEDIKEIDEIMEIIEENGNLLFISILKTTLAAEFGTTDFRFSSSFTGNVNDEDFNFSINLKDHDINSDEAFTSKGKFEIEDVFYLDNFSIFETSKSRSDVNTHVGYLRKMLSEDIKPELFDDKINTRIISIEEKIRKIIGGDFTKDRGRFYFSKENIEDIDMQNTASGIKQIGIIQLLLANRQLKKDCFLIIDEPEVNLHPEWQIKFAEILVLLAKDLDINIYLNSHSPMFIEAISLYAQYYDLINETNVYLTVKDNNKYTFTKIDSKDMGEVYENLTKPYDELDKLKAEIIFRE